MQHIHDRIDGLIRDQSNLARYIERRERYLDTIDWTLMTDDECFDARIEEETLLGDLDYLKMEIEHLGLALDIDPYDDD